ncbi:MAG TPA: TIGR03621 family F420-dependent LLM class oxidoreductase [Ilumatobacteraceae bacterium]
MSTHRPFRFGVQTSKAADRAGWVELATRVEGHGFDVLTIPDHFDDQFAPIPALMTVANATTTLRVGALVWDNDYKHPLVLAKELATMDLLSDGRVEIGIGAGWERSDYDRSGIVYDTAKVRIDRFVEGLAIIKGAMGAAPFSHAGEHYTITEYTGHPQPVQRPCPPILIGGGGKRVLGIAAREADIVGINSTQINGVVDHASLLTMTAEAVEDKVNIVKAAAGDRFDRIELNVRVYVSQFTTDRLARMTDLAAGFGVPVASMEHSPFVLIGTAEQMVEDLLARRERWGFSYMTVNAADIDAFAPVVSALAGR